MSQNNSLMQVMKCQRKIRLIEGRRLNGMEKISKGERRNNMNKEELLWMLRLVLITNSFTATILFGMFKVILIATGN